MFANVPDLSHTGIEVHTVVECVDVPSSSCLQRIFAGLFWKISVDITFSRLILIIRLVTVHPSWLELSPRLIFYSSPYRVETESKLDEYVLVHIVRHTVVPRPAVIMGSWQSLR